MSRPERAALDRLIRRATGASAVAETESLQSLWSGYGEILRATLVGGEHPSVIVKHVAPPTAGRHPRGWSTTRSHERKLRSYDVEMTWYQRYAARCDAQSRVPRALACQSHASEWLFVLEDLDASGFPFRRDDLGSGEVECCLSWLAHFHATFLGTEPIGLWRIGTYWHLGTRPDELARMHHQGLKAAAPALDRRLNGCRHRTLVHGDAKVENFCFAPSVSTQRAVSAVDFQYVGGGAGVKDVAYFFSSIWEARDCEAYASDALDSYFAHLRGALRERRPDVDEAAVEHEWRSLYPLAWADFYRFLDGWAPGHYKMHGYSERLTREALYEL